MQNSSCTDTEFIVALSIDSGTLEFCNAEELGYTLDILNDPNLNNDRIWMSKMVQIPIGGTFQEQVEFQLILGDDNPDEGYGSQNFTVVLQTKPISQTFFDALSDVTFSWSPRTWLASGDFTLSNFIASLEPGVFPITNPNCEVGITKDLVIDGTLRIDQDYCFTFPFASPPPIGRRNIYLTEGSRIIVEQGVHFRMEYCNILQCSGDFWESIEVEDGGLFTISESFISHGENGIRVLDGGELVCFDNAFSGNNRCITNESGTISRLENNTFDNSSVGVFVTGANPEIQTIQLNQFNRLPNGILVDGNENRVDIDAESYDTSNDFNECQRGIQIRNDGAALVRHNEFFDNRIGVLMLNNTRESRIYNNNIGYEDAGIASSNGRFDIATNSIGVVNGRGQIGVWLIGLNDNSEVRKNYIYSDRTSVLSVFSSGVDIHDNPDINCSTTPGVNSSGIQLFMSDNRVADNQVRSNNAMAGIWLNGCTIDNPTNRILHNSIDADSGFRTAGIRVEGSSTQYIDENLTEGLVTQGVFNLNSANNFYDCNELHASINGMFIGDNSITQRIRGNEFYAFTDYLTRSRTGIQEHHGNTFYGLDISDHTDSRVEADGLSFDGVFESRFIVDFEKFDTDNDGFTEYWPENRLPNELFEDLSDQGQTFDDCSGNAGSGGLIPTEMEFCKLFRQLFSGNYSPNARRVNVYHWVVFYVQNLPEALWPQCLKDYLQNDECSDLVSIAESQINLQLIHRTTEEGINRLNNYQSGLNNIKSNLASLYCSDQLFVRYKEVLEISIKFLETLEIDDEMSKTLEGIASLCPTEYGDVVHWSRSMLSIVSDTRYDEYDLDCGANQSEGRESLKLEIEEGLSIYPNPVIDVLTIQSKVEMVSIEIANVSGNVLRQLEPRAKQVNLEVSNLNVGMYLFTITSTDGNTSIKKIFVTK